MFATRSVCRWLLVSLLVAGFVTLVAPSFEAGETTGWAAYKSGNYTAAYKAFLQRAQTGDANAQHNLAVMYDLRQGVPQDLRDAAKWYRLAAEQGHAVSQNNLGIMLENGRGTEQNPAEAAKWYRKAAGQGQAISQHNLALLLEKGAGLPVDHAEAAQWFLKAAEQGLGDAQHNIAWMYAQGIGVPLDRAEAAKWYLRAAEQGRAISQNNLVNLYELGQGVERDFGAAMMWYRRAADQGLANAQYNVGWLYANAVGVSRDNNEAALWYRRAAEHGLADAQFSQGALYEIGNGPQKYYGEALRWYRTAAENGHAQARVAMEALSARGVTVVPSKSGISTRPSPLISAANAAAAKLVPRPGPKPAVPTTLDAIDTVKAKSGTTVQPSVTHHVSLKTPKVNTSLADDAKFAVQVGAFRQAENAGEMMLRLAKNGHEGEIIERPDGKGQIWYVVRVGRFEIKGSARKFAERLRKEGLSSLVVSAKVTPK